MGKNRKHHSNRSNSFSTIYIRLMKQIIFLLLLGFSGTIQAKIWQVGPTRIYTVPSAVASLVADGDTVEIDAGLYTGNVAKWFANNLLIRSVGIGYAHLDAGGNNAEGKAIWVIKGADCTVEGIEFSGCKVPDHNGAGIRQEGKNLTLRNCYFHHNEMGILTSNDGVSNFWFESCEFAFNGYGDGFSHNIYVGNVNSLTMLYCYSHDAHIGHLVKSRARFNHLFYNRLTGENGDGSYEVDLPNGGEAILIGNLIEQGPNSQNGGIISFALENQSHPEQQIVLSHNTLVNDRSNGRFVQFSNATTLVKLVNNLFLGPGTFLQGTTVSLDTSHNIRLTNIASALLEDPANFDYWPTANSPCVEAGTDPGSFNNISLAATFAYIHPLSRTQRWVSGNAPDVGAYEFLVAPYRTAPDVPQGLNLKIFPNPLVHGQRLTLTFEQAPTIATTIWLTNSSGIPLKKYDWPDGKVTWEMELPALAPGMYYLTVPGKDIRKGFLMVH